MYGNFISKNSACIVLNGAVKDYDSLKDIIISSEYANVIAVDGGANHLFKMGIVPDYIVGDLDSIGEEALGYFEDIGVEFYKYPCKKDETDSELGILLAVEKGALCVDIYAALGGRIDHEISNIGLLYYSMKRDVYTRIISEDEDIYILENDELTLDGSPGDIVSVLPFKNDARGVTLRNLEYTLEEFDMDFATPRGISNVMIEDVCHINVRDGCLLIIKQKQVNEGRYKYELI